MDTNQRADANRKYLARALAALVLLEQRSPDRSPLTGEQVQAAIQSWSMQTTMAFLRLSSEPASAREFLKPIEEELRIRLAFSTAILRKPRKVSFSLGMQPEINAFASKTTARDYKVTVYIGAVIALFLGALALVDETTGCASGLELTAERRRNKHVGEFERLWDPLIRAYELSPFAHLLPREPWRIVLAHSILARSLDYLLTHEIGHVLRGHLDYCLRWMKEPSIAEASRGIKDVPPAFSRIIEAQADDHASLQSGMKWHHLSRSHDFGVGPICSGTCGFTYFNAQDICRSVAQSICLVFFVLDYGSRNALDDAVGLPSAGDYGPLNTYPPVEFRLWRALRLSRLYQVAGVDWRAILEGVRGCLVSKGLIGATYLLPSTTLESALEEYERELSDQGAEALSAEKAWVQEGLDVTQPPPKMPKRLWVWKLK